jgi:nitroreductase
MSEHLHWRYATKKFDPFKRISQQDVSEILEALRFAPSSYGLQPWQFLIIQNEALRKELQPYAWDQSQVTDASHLIVLCVWKTLDENYVKNFLKRIARVREMSMESLSTYGQMMSGFIQRQTPESLSDWMRRQVYLALGMFLAECARKKIDACPMEGFDAKKFDEILGLEKRGLQSVVLCAIGYRAQDDHYAGLKKVRFEKSEVFVEK